MSYQTRFSQWLMHWLGETGASPQTCYFLEHLILGLGLILVVAIIDYISRNIILNIVARYAKRSNNPYDDILVEMRVFKHLAHVVPALVAKEGLTFVFQDYATLISPLQKLVDIYIIIAIIFFVQAVLRAIKTLLLNSEDFKDKPIGSYTQLLNIINYLVGILFIVSHVTDKPLWTLLTAFGALSALIILTFRDTILGLVASIQISGNDIVRIDDWIEVPKYGADGHVVEINLTTIKVKNWDNTVTTIPTYVLINDAFKNWRGMEESEGRRMKRSVNIKISSIKFCTPEILEHFKKIDLIRDYVTQKESEINQYNAAHKINKSVLANGRNLTNVGIFREYLSNYIQKHPKVNKELIMMVRQLPPTDKGLPLEIYCFTLDKEWVDHETIAADIFDHVLATIPSFDLEIFEGPTGKDFQAAISAK
jgi:miniconductance mechanosensitive channel